MSVLSERLRARIKELGIPIREAARRCGVDNETDHRKFHHAVVGRNDPSTEMVLRICDRLQISPNELYGFQPVPAGLAPDEAALLEKYRALSSVQRTALLTLIAVSRDITSLPFTGT